MAAASQQTRVADVSLANFEACTAACVCAKACVCAPRVLSKKISSLPRGSTATSAHVTAGMTWPLDDGELGGGGVLWGWAREEHRRRQACSLPAPVEPKM